MKMDRKESDVYLRLDSARLPQHIAIIMDGNGRWARRRHMPRVADTAPASPPCVPPSKPPPASEFPP